MSQKLEKLKSNWPQKIIALIIAITLYAFYQITQLDTKTLLVPLQVRQNGAYVQNSAIQRNASINLRGRPQDISQLEVSDFVAFVDLSYIEKAGQTELPIQLELSSRAVELSSLEIQIKPSKIKVDVQKRKIATIPIKPNIYGMVKEGYEVDSIVTEPLFVRVSGSETAVDSVDYFTTDAIIIDEIDSSIEQKVSVINRNNLLTLETDSVPLVKVLIKETIEQSTFNSIPIQLTNTKGEFDFIANIDFASLTLEGTYNRLKNYKIPTSYAGIVDCSGIIEEGTYNLPIVYPKFSNFEITNVSDETVEIVVSKALIEESETELHNHELTQKTNGI